MRTKLFVVAAGLALSLAMAPTASANRPLHGDQVMVSTVNPGQCPTDLPGIDFYGINWYGTIDFDDGHGAYGMVLYDIGVAPVFNGNSYHWEEGLAIWEHPVVDDDEDGYIDNCDAAGDMLLSGTDKGVAALKNANAKFHSTGTVLTASGAFAGWEGRFVFQEGVANGFVSFTGTLRLN